MRDILLKEKRALHNCRLTSLTAAACRVRLPLRFVFIVLRKRSYTWLKNIQITRQFSSNARPTQEVYTFAPYILYYICIFYLLYLDLLNMDRKKGSRRSRREEDFRKSRPKKRKNVFNPKLAESNEASFSTSAKNLEDNDDLTVPQDSSVEYRILNFITVFSAISNLVKCKTCNSNIKFKTASTRGLGFKLVVKCDSCESQLIPSSPFISHSYEINRRFIFTMRVLGIGLAGAQKFCGLMDMPNFLSESTYTLILKNIHECVKTAIDIILKKAVREEIENTPEVADDNDNAF